MAEQTFLQKLAERILNDYSENLPDLVVILPNRRAKVFLIEALKERAAENIFAPQITSIEDFVQDIAGIRSVDDIQILFEFYNVYLELTPFPKQQSFDIFANWAKTLLKDFNEIDRYLIDPDHVFSYLQDIDDIKRWGIETNEKTTLIEKYVDFWKLLPNYYTTFYDHLLAKGIGYQGLIYREATRNLTHFSTTVSAKKFVFAGFNALNAAEEKVIQHLIEIGAASIVWDIDSVFLQNSHHDAGLFVRRFKNHWKHYKSNLFEWISTDFSQQKNISIIGTPKAIGQARTVGSIIQQKLQTGNSTALHRVAIVLGEENLLIPLLYSLPSGIESLNITMGYAAKNNPAQVLVAKLFKMHTNALSRSGGYVFYYKDVLDILTHPLVEPYVEAKSLVSIIKRNNFSFISHSRLFSLNELHTPLFEVIFEKWDNKPLAALENVSSLLKIITEYLKTDHEEEKISRAFVYSIFKVINKLITYFSENTNVSSMESLHAIYKQIIDLAEVSFEGEPLTGLQIMGVLESRVLDFETVIITSMNEGKFPAGKSQDSFIPYDVKRELGLPTFKEKDAIYTFHFYHLLQRAKNIYLLYNTESDGLDGGEKSRFITQLEVEKQELHTLTHEIYNPQVPDIAHKSISIPKSDSVMERLQEIAIDGFSPSALTSYIRNPMQFYLQKVLRIREADEVEESIALNTLGTIIHEALRELYEPLINKVLTVDEIKECIVLADEKVLEQFRIIYKEGEIKKGRNLLAFEVAKRNVLNFLKFEMTSIEAGESIKILALEQTYTRILEHPDLPFSVNIRGNVDRIEERNGIIRIIDYKTGKVEARNLCIDHWGGLVSDIKNDKIIQVLAYAFLFEERLEARHVEVGIISFKNMKNGFLPFTFKHQMGNTTFVNKEIAENYKEQLVVLLKEILDQNMPFTEKTA